MRAGAAVRWIGIDLRAHPLRTLIGVAGVSLGVAALTFFLALGAGLRAFAVGPGTRDDATLLEVVPRSMELGIFRINRPGLLGASGLDPLTVERVSRLDGVERVYPKRVIRLPLMAQGGAGLIGKDMATDLFAEGLSAELLASDVPAAALRWQPGQPIPVIVNTQILAMFNGSVAEAIGAPKLAADAAVGFEFDLIVGRSFMMGNKGAKKAERLRAKLVGFSPHAMRLGVSVPLDVADALEREFRDETVESVFTAIYVRVADAAKASAIATAIEKFGLKLSDSGRKTADAISIATLVLTLIAALILTLASFNITQTFAAQLIERRAELALLKALGATPRTIALLAFGQATITGALGGALGLGIGAAATLVSERALAQMVSDIPLRPAQFFVLEPGHFAIGLAVALLAAWSGVIGPALRAMRDSPARVLSAVE